MTKILVDTERHRLPIFTFDFTDFRVTESADGPWRLAINENILQRELSR